MEENFDIREHQLTSRERDFENALRPLNFSDFSGQDKVVDNLRIFVKAARLRAEALDHVLLHGPPGLGKTTLSNIIANDQTMSCLLMRFIGSVRWWKNIFIRPWRIIGLT